jgi:hypothetical protein
MNRNRLGKILRVFMVICFTLNVGIAVLDGYTKGDLSKLGWYAITMGAVVLLAMLCRKYAPDQAVFASTGTFTPRAIAFRDLIGLFAMGIGAGAFGASALILHGRNNGMAAMYVGVALMSIAGAFVIGRRTLRKIPSLSGESAA